MKILSRHRTFVMGFAALWIYIFHIFPSASGSGILPYGYGLFKRLGSCEVGIFLVGSSCGLSYSLDKNSALTPKSYLSYLLRRFKRLYFVVIPVALFIGLWDGWSLRGFVGRITGTAQLFINVYRFLWFLPCILIFYALSPLYYGLFKRIKQKGLFTLVMCLLVPYLNYRFRNDIRGDLFAITTRVSVFLLGFYLGHLSKTKPKLTPFQLVFPLSAMIFGILLNILLTVGKIPWYFLSLNAQINLLIAPGIAVCLSLAGDFLSKHGAVKWLYSLVSHFGSISFEFYATQEWIWGKVLTCGLGTLPTQLICFSLTLFASELLHLTGNWLSRFTISKKE